MSKIKSFYDVRNMSDKELADWLGDIWRVGWTIGSLDSPISNCPNFYERLGGKDKYSCFDIQKIHKTDDGTPVVVELRDKDEELTVSTKWDGCIDLNYNDDYIHICNVEDFISKLQEVIKISEEHFENWT